MRTGTSRKHPARLATLLVVLVGALVYAAPALAVSGADYTTVNTHFDGTGRCQNGNPNVNCNIYTGKQFVWINGGPNNNKLGPDGYYFFAVLAPSGQQDPNDGTPSNLSDDYDTYQNRTFRIVNGEIASYTGTHIQDVDTNDNNELKIRAYPYADTPNPGGVYIMAICYIGANTTTLPGGRVDPKTCKYDAFKVPTNDTTPPGCPHPTFAYNTDGKWTATATFSDAGGIDILQPIDVVNAVVTITNFYQGTVNTVTLTASKINNNAPARVVIFVRDVGGNTTTCDPVLTTVRAGAAHAARQSFARLTRHESKVRIRNAGNGLRRLVVHVNGHRFVVRHLRSKESRTLNIRSALTKAGRNNRVSLHGYGRSGSSATVLISN